MKDNNTYKSKIHSREEIRKASLEFFKGDEIAATAWKTKYGIGEIENHEPKGYGHIAYYLLLNEFDLRGITDSDLRCVLVYLNKVLKASIKAILRDLALYLSKFVNNQYAHLNKAFKHFFSIFFGLCCSSPGYIYDAFSTTSSHPCPSAL